jgi:hypothetical protein
MTIRQLTQEEARRIAGKRKPDGQRPRYYDASTAKFVEVTTDFETLVLLLPLAFRARIGQYLTALYAANIGPSTMDELRTEWLTKRHTDLDSSADAYGATVTSYEDIRAKLIEAGVGFENVVEYQRILADLTKTVGSYVDDYDDVKFSRSVTNVLLSRATARNSSNPTKAELDSFIQVMLQYP